MSGGSYDYLHRQDFVNVNGIDPDTVWEMAKRLKELGLTLAAVDTLKWYDYLQSDPVDLHSPTLRDLWKEVEWLDSGDTGLDTFCKRAGEKAPLYFSEYKGEES